MNFKASPRGEDEFRVDQSTGEVIWLYPQRDDQEGANQKCSENRGLYKAKVQKTGQKRLGKSKKLDFSLRWGATDNELLMKMIQLKLPANPRAVIDALMMKAEKGNEVVITRADLAKITDIRENHISTHLREVISADLVLRLGHDRYMVNPLHYWKGPHIKRAEAIAAYYQMKDRAGQKQPA